MISCFCSLLSNNMTRHSYLPLLPPNKGISVKFLCSPDHEIKTLAGIIRLVCTLSWLFVYILMVNIYYTHILKYTKVKILKFHLRETSHSRKSTLSGSRFVWLITWRRCHHVVYTNLLSETTRGLLWSLSEQFCDEVV